MIDAARRDNPATVVRNVGIRERSGAAFWPRVSFVRRLSVGVDD